MGNKNDERVVYLALKKVFKGPNARVPQPKAIRKLITEHQHQEDIAAFVKAQAIFKQACFEFGQRTRRMFCKTIDGLS
jgi:hypothetical protein